MILPFLLSSSDDGTDRYHFPLTELDLSHLTMNDICFFLEFETPFARVCRFCAFCNKICRRVLHKRKFLLLFLHFTRKKDFCFFAFFSLSFRVKKRKNIHWGGGGEKTNKKQNDI